MITIDNHTQIIMFLLLYYVSIYRLKLWHHHASLMSNYLKSHSQCKLKNTLMKLSGCPFLAPTRSFYIPDFSSAVEHQHVKMMLIVVLDVKRAENQFGYVIGQAIVFLVLESPQELNYNTWRSHNQQMLQEESIKLDEYVSACISMKDIQLEVWSFDEKLKTRWIWYILFVTRS